MKQKSPKMMLKTTCGELQYKVELNLGQDHCNIVVHVSGSPVGKHNMPPVEVEVKCDDTVVYRDDAYPNLRNMDWD